jgi:hypothetical protein
MGLGVGVDCKVCGEQLRYGDDTDEIIQSTTVDDTGKLHVTKSFVLCHECKIVAEKLSEQTGEK